MTLATSGEISLGGSTATRSINLELGQAATATVSLNDANVRTLAGVASGAIVVPTDFYGKSNFTPGTFTFTASGTFTLPAGYATAEIEVWGGGGGATSSGNGGAGGGGSSYTTNAAFTLIAGSNAAGGSNAAPGTTDPYYQGGVAAGGSAGVTGGPGLVVITGPVVATLSITSGTATMSWSSVSGTTSNYWVLYRSTTSNYNGISNTSGSNAGISTSATASGLAAGKFWYFTIASSNIGGTSAVSVSSIVSY